MVGRFEEITFFIYGHHLPVQVAIREGERGDPRSILHLLSPPFITRGSNVREG